MGGDYNDNNNTSLAKSIVVCNDANAWDPEKTNGCSSAAAAAAATAVSKRNADGGFLSVLTQAVPSRAKLCSAAQRPPVRAWAEGGALCGFKALVSL